MNKSCRILSVLLSICASKTLMCMQVEQHSDPKVIVEKLIALSPAEFEALSQDAQKIQVLEDFLSKHPQVIEDFLRTYSKRAHEH